MDGTIANTKFGIIEEDGDYTDIKPFIVTIYEYTDSAYKFVYKQEDGSEYFEGEMEILKKAVANTVYN